MRRGLGRLVSDCGACGAGRVEKKAAMLLAIAAILLVLWLFGLIAVPTAGALVHVLLIIAVIVVVMHFLGVGRRGSVSS